MNILRNVSREERKDFTSLMDSDPKRKITNEVETNFQKAMKKGLPFCRPAVWDFINDDLDKQSKESLRKNGFVKADDIKLPKIDWASFSDVKNFKILEDGETYSEDLSTRYSLPVFLKKIKYQFKDTHYTITVMEDGLTAVKRIKDEQRKEDTGQTQ